MVGDHMGILCAVIFVFSFFFFFFRVKRPQHLPACYCSVWPVAHERTHFLLCRSDAHRFLLPCPAPLLLCRGRRYSSFRPSVTYFSRLFLFFFFFLVTLLLHSSSSQSLTLCHWHYRYHYHRPFHPREVSWIWTRQDRMTFPKTGQGEGECSRQGTRGFKVVQGVYSSY